MYATYITIFRDILNELKKLSSRGNVSWSKFNVSSRIFHLQFNILRVQHLTTYWKVNNIIYIVMCLSYGVRLLQEGSIEVAYICEMIIALGLCVRHLILYLQRTNLTELIILCKALWSNLRLEEITYMRMFERKVYYLRVCFLWASSVVCIAYVFTALLVNVASVDHNGTSRKILPIK